MIWQVLSPVTGKPTGDVITSGIDGSLVHIDEEEFV